MTGSGGSDDTRNPSSCFWGRAIAALLQAASIYVLLDGIGIKPTWPATDPTLFEPLLLIAIYVPLIVMIGLGNIGGRALAAWAVLAAVILVLLGYHDATRGRFLFPAPQTLWPWFQLWVAVTPALFAANVLATDSILERRVMPSYARHFDTAWKQGAQIVFAAIFVGLFWGVLYLGSSLFSLIQLNFLKKLIDHLWFSCPATTLAIAVAFHLTDVQPTLLRGARSFALTLFSWLLPLIALLVLGFLVSLPFVSLEPLWRTHFATSALLAAQGLLIFFLNCWYQDGVPAQQGVLAKRWAAAAGSLELPLLAGLAAWGLSVRVRQYGWTEERIFGAALIAVSICYAVGYALSRPWTGRPLPLLEKANFLTAYVSLALVLALFTVAADPARLMVADQTARLRSGTTPIETFDFAALKFDGAKWGLAALQELATTQDIANASAVNEKAGKALAQSSPYFAVAQAISSAELPALILVGPPGHDVPAELSDAIIKASDPVTRTFCLRTKSSCVLRFLTLGGDHTESALFVALGSGRLFVQDGSGGWTPAAKLMIHMNCRRTMQAFAEDDIAVEQHPWPDLVVAGQRLSFIPDSFSCP